MIPEKTLSALENLDSSNFDEIVGDGKTPVIVDFWADWCVPCRTIEPLLEEISDLMGDKLRFARVNVDESRDLAIRYHVQSLPTLLVFQDGRPVDTITGVPPRYSLISRLEKHL